MSMNIIYFFKNHFIPGTYFRMFPLVLYFPKTDALTGFPFSKLLLNIKTFVVNLTEISKLKIQMNGNKEIIQIDVIEVLFFISFYLITNSLHIK